MSAPSASELREAVRLAGEDHDDTCVGDGPTCPRTTLRLAGYADSPAGRALALAVAEAMETGNQAIEALKLAAITLGKPHMMEAAHEHESVLARLRGKEEGT